MVFQPLNLPLFLTNSFRFLTLLVHFLCPGKLAYIFSTPKRSEKSDPLNYRPIGIASCNSKTIVTIITKQLITFLETSNLLYDLQYSFRKSKSNGDLLAYAAHDWFSAIESYDESRVISLDIPRPLIASGTRVFSLNYKFLVSTSLSLNRMVASSLIGQLSSEETASSLICTPSILVYPRTLSSLLYSSFTS